MFNSLLYLLTTLILCSVFVTHLTVIRHHQYDRENSSKSVYTFQFIPPNFQFIYNFLRTPKETATTADPHHPPPYQRNRTCGQRSGTTN